jgi:multidrug resistance protein MdtO
MASIAQSLPASSGRYSWLWGWLRDELTPYPGRALLVARMVMATTLVMIISMTFQIPYATYAAYFALTISRESVAGTAAETLALVVGSLLGGAYVVVSAMLVVGNEMLRFLWVAASLFLAFYVVSALSNYAAATRFAYLVVITIPVLDRQIPGQSKVASILWAVGSLAIGSVVALLMEIVFAAFRRTDDLTKAILDRLAALEELLAYYLEDRPIDAAARSTIERLASVGTSRLRRILQRAGYEAQHEQRMAAVVALVGRLVDLAAARLAQFTGRVNEGERERIRQIAQDVAEFRKALEEGRVPCRTPPTSTGETPAGHPLLAEAAKTVSLLYETCTGAQSLAAFAPPAPEARGQAIPLVPGALSNPEHVKFALRGCLAASLSYFVYNALFWPGISTAITTCLVTALTTVGASHQKELLRFAGAFIGGFVIGMGAQVFILPNIDSIGAFTVLFAIVSAIAAWFATASTRLSYFGAQIALAFYLINLQEFKFQTSLAVARDRVVGIFLGLLMMWLAFDQLWSAPAGVQMKRTFVAGLRLLAQLAREPVSSDLRIAIERCYSLRETIHAQFDRVRSLADGVLFEFGPSRQRDLELRDQIRRWQPQLRTLFVMRNVSWRYRAQLPGFELPESVRLRQQAYDDHSAHMLEEMAEWIERNAPHAENSIEESHELLNRTAEEIQAEEPAQLSPSAAASFAALLRSIDSLTTSLASEIGAEFGSPPELS